MNRKDRKYEPIVKISQGKRVPSTNRVRHMSLMSLRNFWADATKAEHTVPPHTHKLWQIPSEVRG
jgi:hypothetical protein